MSGLSANPGTRMEPLSVDVRNEISTRFKAPRCTSVAAQTNDRMNETRWRALQRTGRGCAEGGGRKGATVRGLMPGARLGEPAKMKGCGNDCFGKCGKWRASHRRRRRFAMRRLVSRIVRPSLEHSCARAPYKSVDNECPRSKYSPPSALIGRRAAI